MVYKDLEVVIFKKDNSQKETSWVVNAFIKKSYPSKRARTVVDKIGFKEVTYKEFDNYL